MGKINLLDKHTAELIAAGEVVERPASVIKELVENAIDAGASTVTVEIARGGTTLMRLTDNGSGMEREDIPKAFLRHATSKVKEPEDLNSILTLGFRGEALASVAAVSKVEVLTCTGDEPTGYRYRIEGGEEVSFEEAGCPKGTTIYVRDIFYNIPARMKFLKKDVTESNAVSAIMDRIALSHPEISIRFIRDGKEELRTPGDGKLKSAIFAVYGKEFTANLLETSYALNSVTVTGYICKPAAARPNRNMQVFFINGRYVKTMTAMAAIEQAFKGSIMVGKFPSCVLHINAPPEMVDVNVHPAKIEVRFSNDRPVFDAVYHGVKSALLSGDTPREMQFPAPPPAPLTSPESVQMRMSDSVVPSAYPSGRTAPIQPIVSIDRETELYAPPVRVNTGRPFSLDIDVEPTDEKTAEPIPPRTEEYRETIPSPVPEQAEAPVRFVGEAFTTYAIFQSGDRLILLDKHAAHERILYEQLKKTQGEKQAQMLLSPITVTLPKEEFAVLLEHREILFGVGIELEEFGAGTILIRAIPSILDGADAEDQVTEIAGHLLKHGREVTTEHLDWIYHNIACRAAIKGGTDSRPEELLELARLTLENPDIRYCPHGRPTSIVLTRKELEKQFGRVQ